jgi:hypothetical protein
VMQIVGEVVGVNLRAVPNESIVVTLDVAEPFSYDGPAHIHVLNPPSAATLAFLDEVDPDGLEAAALELIGGIGGPKTGEAFLTALKAMAAGA